MKLVIAMVGCFLWTTPCLGEVWTTPRPVRRDVTSMDANFNQIWAYYRYAQPGRNGRTGQVEQITSDTARKVKILDTLLAPSRERYFYVEVLPTFIDGLIWPNFDDGTDPKYGRDHFVRWDTNPVAMRVRVHRLSGELAATVDLPQSYCGNYGEGQWLGENWVWLRHRSGHRTGNFYSLFVNVATRQKRLVGWQIRSAAAPTDGRHLAFKHKRVLYLDFRPVYPIRSEEIPDFGEREGWMAYKKKYMIDKEKRPHERRRPGDPGIVDYLFGPHGKTLLVLAHRADVARQRPQLRYKDAVYFLGTDLVFLDLEKVGGAKDPSEYSRMITLAKGKPRRLERDDAKRELRVLDSDTRAVLWRCSFDDLANPSR